MVVFHLRRFHPDPVVLAVSLLLLQEEVLQVGRPVEEVEVSECLTLCHFLVEVDPAVPEEVEVYLHSQVLRFRGSPLHQIFCSSTE